MKDRMRAEADFENARFLKSRRLHVVIPQDDDPGPVPHEREIAGPKFPSDRSMLMAETAERCWVTLVQAVQGSGDRDAIRAAGAFYIAMHAFLTRDQ